MATKPPRIPGFFTPDRDRLWAGAATLDWCDANDPDNTPVDERIAELESALNDVYAAAVDLNTSSGTARHGKLFRSIEEIYNETIDR